MAHDKRYTNSEKREVTKLVDDIKQNVFSATWTITKCEGLST